MLCREIMQHPVRWLAQDDSVELAARIMRDENIGFLPICDRSGRFIGTVTDRDLAVRVIANGQCTSTTVGVVMTHETVTCSPDDDVCHAAELMEHQRKQRIVCADDGGHVLGVVSLSDLALHTDSARVGETVRGIASRVTRVE